MAAKLPLDQARAADVLRGCTVDAVLPQATSFGLADLLVHNKSGDALTATRAPTSWIPQRTTVYLDESITAFVVLRCPHQSEDDLKAFISRLSVKVDAYAVTDDAGDAKSRKLSTTGKELVDSATIEDANDPEIALEDGREADTNENEQEEIAAKYVYLSWRVQVHITRTRFRGLSSHLYLSAICTLQNTTTTSTTPSFHTPPTPNLLAPLSFDPCFKAFNSDSPSRNTAPILPAARLQKHIPTDAVPPPPSATLKSATRTLFRLKAALHARLKYETIGGSPNTKRMLVALDLEVAPSISYQAGGVCIDVESIDMALAEGTVESIAGAELAIPLHMRAGDASTMLYELQLSPLKVRRMLEGAGVSSVGLRGAAAHVLSVRTSAVVRNSSSESDQANALGMDRRILIQFRTTLDLSPLHRRLARQIHPSHTHLALEKHQLKLSIVTLPLDGRLGVCRWEISLENLSDRTRSPRIKPLMVHEAASSKHDPKAGPELVPLTPILDFSNLRAAGGTATCILEWSTVDAAKLKGANPRRQIARIGGLRFLDLDVEMPTEKLPDVFIEA